MRTLVWDGLGLPATAWATPRVGLGPDGAVVLAGRLRGVVDLDPGPGVREVDGGDGRGYVLALGPDGALAYAGLVDPHLSLDAMAVGPDGAIYLAGVVTGPLGESADFDPGPGSDVRPLGNRGQNLYVTALGPDGAYRWTRVAERGPGSPTVSTVSAAIVDSRGRVVIGAQGLSLDFDPGPEVAPLSGTLLWYLTSDGDTELAQEVTLLELRSLTAGADGDVIVHGYMVGEWDADPTAGVDVRKSQHLTTEGVFRGGSVVTVLRGDHSYGFTGVLDERAEVTRVAVDADGDLYVGGYWGSTTGKQAVDFEPGAGELIVQAGLSGAGFLTRWARADGAVAWVRPSLTAWFPENNGLAVSELDVLTAGPVKGGHTDIDPNDPVVPEGPSDLLLTARGLTASEPRWEVLLRGSGAVWQSHVLAGADRRLALVGRFSGELRPDPADPALTFASAATGPADASTFLTLLFERDVAWTCLGPTQPALGAPGTCPLACESVGWRCGGADPACPGGAQCGECPDGQVCGGAGTEHMCSLAASVLAEGLDHPRLLTLDATHAWFVTEGAQGAHDSALHRAPLQGGGPSQVVASGAWSLIGALGVMDADHLYITVQLADADFALWRVRKSDGEVLELLRGAATPVATERMGGTLYVWIGGVGFGRLPADGSGAFTELTGLPCPISAVRALGGRLLATCPDDDGKAIYTLDPDGTAAVRHYLTAAGIVLLGADATHLWFVESTENGNAIRRIPRDAVDLRMSDAETVLTNYITYFPATGLTFDDGSLYSAYGGPEQASTRGGVIYFSAGADAPTPIVEGINHLGAFALTDDAIIWTERGDLSLHTTTGRLMRAARPD
ncbi:MAG: hypothetical protein H6746_14015 [Deltaproteobacteria bacterium]|nr:hypothetical protein [Deltaproteobacteria bacterium]